MLEKLTKLCDTVFRSHNHYNGQHLSQELRGLSQALEEPEEAKDSGEHLSCGGRLLYGPADASYAFHLVLCCNSN